MHIQYYTHAYTHRLNTTYMLNNYKYKLQTHKHNTHTINNNTYMHHITHNICSTQDKNTHTTYTHIPTHINIHNTHTHTFTSYSHNTTTSPHIGITNHDMNTFHKHTIIHTLHIAHSYIPKYTTYHQFHTAHTTQHT